MVLVMAPTHKCAGSANEPTNQTGFLVRPHEPEDGTPSRQFWRCTSAVPPLALHRSEMSNSTPLDLRDPKHHLGARSKLEVG
jgi:hypothetical protein